MSRFVRLAITTPFKGPNINGTNGGLFPSATVPQPAAIVAIAVEIQASVLLVPVAARRQLNELPDEIWTKINIEFYSEPADAFFKSLTE
jgi:predicted ATP-dependent Lon-type protease